MSFPSRTIVQDAPPLCALTSQSVGAQIPLRRRSTIKTTLQKLPWGFGTRVVVPILRWVLAVFVYRRPITKWNRKRVARQEAARIEAHIDAGANRAIVVYDLRCSPPTFGDYLVVILLARYFQARGLPLEFYLITSELRTDWDALSLDEAITRVQDQYQLAINLLRDANTPHIQAISAGELQRLSLQWGADCVVPFFANVKSRIPFYNHAFNVLNCLLAHASRAACDRTLFHERHINAHLPNKPLMPYITWHARYSKKWGPERNIDESQFCVIYRTLAQRFPNHAIVLVSDADGCEYFKSFAKKNDCSLHFSKDFSETFLGDAALVLQSAYYFQLHGGGIGIFPMFSRMPYTIVGNLANEERWSRARVTSWQTPFQQFLEYQDGFCKAMIPADLPRNAGSAS